MGREKFFFFLSTCMHMCVGACVYLCIFVVIHLSKLCFWQCVLQKSPGGVHICVYQALRFFCPNRTYARMCAQVHFHVCSVDVIWCVPVCKKEQRANVHMKARGEHVHVCGRLGPAEVHPTLVRAQCRVTQVSNGNSTQTHTHIQSRTRSSAGAKVNR